MRSHHSIPEWASHAEVVSGDLRDTSVRREALVMAFSDVFLALAFLFGAIVLLVPLAQKPQARGGGGGGGH